MENRYINKDSGNLKSEVVGGLIGGAVGSLGINATQAYRQYKTDNADLEQLKRELPELESNRHTIQNAFDDASMLHQIKNDPRVLDELPEDAKSYYTSIYDTAQRLQGRSDFDRINELPFRERIQLFIKGKPSIRDVDPDLVEHVVSKFGERPFDEDVINTLRHQAGKMDKNLDLLREITQAVPKLDIKAALPTLDQYRPKQLVRTISNPLVAGGAMVGYGVGMFRDEYKQHLSHVKQRNEGIQEMPKEAGFSSVFKKLLPTKPPIAPEIKQTAKKPLIPKSVKRTGLILGAAGVGGYSAVKAKNDFTAGMKMTPSAQKLEGMDSNMKKTAELYAELEKVALSVNGIKDGAKVIADKAKGQAGNLKDIVSGKGVKKAEEVLASRKAMSGVTGEAVGELAPKNVTKEKVKRVGAIAGIGGAGAGIAGGAAGAVVEAKREKTAKEVYEDLEKYAKEMEKEKSEYALAHPIAKTVKDGAKWGAIAGLPFFGIGAIPGAIGGAAFGLQQGLGRSMANKELAKEDGMDPRLAGGLMGGGVAVGMNIPSALRTAAKTRATGLSPIPGLVGTFGSSALAGGGIGALMGNNQEKHYNNVHSGQFETTQALEAAHQKKASELYDELSKVAGIGTSVKNAFGKAKDVVSGKNVEKAQGVLDNRLKMHGETGEAIGRLAPQQLKKEKAKRAGALAGIGVAGAAATGAAAVGVDRHRKSASELYEDLMKEAGIGTSVKNALGKAKDVVSGKNVEKAQAVLDNRLKMHGETGEAIGRLAPQQLKKEKAKRAGALAGIGVAGAAATGAAAVGVDRHRKSASEVYENLMKEAGALQGLKNLGGKLAGKPVKQIERYQAELGDSAHLQKHLESAKASTNKARGVVAGGVGLAGAGTVGGVMAAKSGQSDAQQKKADEESTDIEKVAHEAINSLFGDKVDAILEDKLEKIASHTDPLDRITFGYENLKK